MPEKLTEAQARRICEALGEWPDKERRFYRRQNEPDLWPDVAPEVPDFGEASRNQIRQRVPLWRIVQRAAAEEKP